MLSGGNFQFRFISIHYTFRQEKLFKKPQLVFPSAVSGGNQRRAWALPSGMSIINEDKKVKHEYTATDYQPPF
jgi:hypothetical protein